MLTDYDYSCLACGPWKRDETVLMCWKCSDVVLGLGPSLSLRTEFQSLVLFLALSLESLVLALVLKVQPLTRTTPKTKAKDNTTETITYLIL